MRLIKSPPKAKEETMEDISFNVHKFNARPKPKDIRKILIISTLFEFGCETLSVLYSIPKVLQNYGGLYVIVLGWYGRSYLYRHLADEFWELKEEHQWLRDYSNAFSNSSKNIALLHKEVAKLGNFCPPEHLAACAIVNSCKKCNHYWREDTEECPNCKNATFVKSLFNDIHFWKRLAIPLPPPSPDKMEEAKKYLKPKSVAVFARGRATYGRNLQPEFYVKLVKLLRDMGYNPIWLGEKQSTQACPVDGIIDMSRKIEARDLELTFAIVKQCEFTVQFWTASTRLAGMMGVPYILAESPDQIWGIGQEGYRRNLCDFGPRKLIVSHFWNAYNDNEAFIDLTKRAILEMNIGNYEDIFGLLETEHVAQQWKKENDKRIGAYT
ncbi:MAG: hypothetical protein M0R80_01705 [Proteobacteria bacterium]|jgi:hypothetical protein|nr:hypothetical protein [Pseudomonadota bacterium]